MLPGSPRNFQKHRGFQVQGKPLRTINICNFLIKHLCTPISTGSSSSTNTTTTSNNNDDDDHHHNNNNHHHHHNHHNHQNHHNDTDTICPGRAGSWPFHSFGTGSFSISVLAPGKMGSCDQNWDANKQTMRQNTTIMCTFHVLFVVFPPTISNLSSW